MTVSPDGVAGLPERRQRAVRPVRPQHAPAKPATLRTHNNAWRPRPTTIHDMQTSVLGVLADL